MPSTMTSAPRENLEAMVHGKRRNSSMNLQVRSRVGPTEAVGRYGLSVDLMDTELHLTVELTFREPISVYSVDRTNANQATLVPPGFPWVVGTLCNLETFL